MRFRLRQLLCLSIVCSFVSLIVNFKLLLLSSESATDRQHRINTRSRTLSSFAGFKDFIYEQNPVKGEYQNQDPQPSSESWSLRHSQISQTSLTSKRSHETKKKFTGRFKHDKRRTKTSVTRQHGRRTSAKKLVPDKLQSFKDSCWHANFSPPAPINHTPLPFIIDPASLCSGDVFLLLVVHSAVSHRERRDLIRSTWGSVRNIRGDRIVTVFVVGTTSEPTVSESLKREAETQADILQADFVDSYRNLTYKHLYWLKWVTHNCHSLRFVMKADDDVMINVFRLHQALKNQMSGWKNFLNCILNRSRPFRNPKSKWFVTYDEWPTNRYPVYCKGFGYTMSADIIKKLHMCAKWRKYFWIDDVFVSGALATAVKVRKYHWFFGFRTADMSPKLAGPGVKKLVIISVNSNVVNSTLHKQVWKAVLSHDST